MHGGLSGLDLNLLYLFEALATTRQVTAAAKRVGLSQSAASHALKRLRDAVGDPLLVRGREGLVLTPRGEALAGGVRSALGTLANALEDEGVFDPATSRRSFTVAGTDGFDLVMFPALIDDLYQQAPGIAFSVVRPPSRGIEALLETGAVDLYYGVLPSIAAFRGLLVDPGETALKTTPVYEEHWSLVVRRGHPRIRRKPTLEAYAAEAHVLYSPTGGGVGVVDRLLETEGLARRVAVRVSDFRSALEWVKRTDLVWTGPRRMGKILDPEKQLLHLTPPLALPVYSTRLVWHERFDNDPGHRWFRQTVAGAVRSRSAGG